MPSPKAKRLTTNPEPTEHQIQSAFVDYVHVLEARYDFLKLSFAVPNAAKRSVALATYMKREGLRKGVLDWHLPYPSRSYRGLMIEFKRTKQPLTKEQADYMALAEKYGTCVRICYSAPEAMHALEQYLGSPL